jgi:thiamine pyrophosphate-dependent acetolactate synthase large subunit-like protein
MDNRNISGHTNLVYTIIVKNITLSADEHLIELARNKAREQHTTLNEAFREWLVQFTAQEERVKQYKDLMRELRHISPGRRFSRDEMNER